MGHNLSLFLLVFQSCIFVHAFSNLHKYAFETIEAYNLELSIIGTKCNDVRMNITLKCSDIVRDLNDIEMKKVVSL